MEIDLGKVDVRCNPECATPSKAEALAVGSQLFLQNNGNAVRSYVLVIRARCVYNSSNIGAPPTPDSSICNGHSQHDDSRKYAYCEISQLRTSY